LWYSPSQIAAYDESVLQRDKFNAALAEQERATKQEEEKRKAKEMLDKLLRKSFDTTETQNKKIDQRNPAFSEDQYIEREMRKTIPEETNPFFKDEKWAQSKNQETPKPDQATLDKLKASYKDTYLPNIEKQEAEKRARLKSEFTPQFAKEQTESMATGAGYSDSSDVVRKSGLYGDEMMTPTASEIFQKRKAGEQGFENVSENPKIKKLVELAKFYDAQGDEKLADKVRMQVSDYLFKSAMADEGGALKKELQTTNINAKKEMQGSKQAHEEKILSAKQEAEKWMLGEKQKYKVMDMQNDFENDVKKMGLGQKYKQQIMAAQNQYKAAEAKAEKAASSISKEPGGEDYIKAFKNINSEYRSKAKFYFEQDNKLDMLNAVISDPRSYQNPAAYGMIQTGIARGLNGEVGVLTDSDLRRAGLDVSLLGQLNASILKASEGKFDPSDLENAKMVIKVRKQQSDDAKKAILQSEIYGATDSYKIETNRMMQTFESTFNRMTEATQELPQAPTGKPVVGVQKPIVEVKKPATLIDGGFKTRSGNNIIFE
jgi:hypothetical protein